MARLCREPRNRHASLLVAGGTGIDLVGGLEPGWRAYRSLPLQGRSRHLESPGSGGAVGKTRTEPMNPVLRRSRVCIGSGKAGVLRQRSAFSLDVFLAQG